MNVHVIGTPTRSAIFTGILIAAGCVAHLPSGVSTPTLPGSTPTPPGPTTSGCSANASPAPGAQQIAMTLAIAPPTATPQPYGLIGGFGIVTPPAPGSSAPATFDGNASTISLLPADTVQFQNVEVSRSLAAVGLPSSAIGPSGAFPSTYAFPASASSASGTQIDGRGTWSTGAVAPGCYSQVFTFVGNGTYYFGDINFYAAPNYVRNVFVITASAPLGNRRKP